MHDANGAGAWAGMLSFSSTSRETHPSGFRAVHTERTINSPSKACLLERLGNAEGGRDTLQSTMPHALLSLPLGPPPPLPSKPPLQRYERAQSKKSGRAVGQHLRTEQAHRAAETEEWHAKMSYHRQRQLHSLARQHDSMMSRYPQRAMTASASWSDLSASAFLPTRSASSPHRGRTPATQRCSSSSLESLARSDMSHSLPSRPSTGTQPVRPGSSSCNASWSNLIRALPAY